MESVRYIVLTACQNAGLYAQAGWESEAAAWLEKQGSRPCAYVGYRRGIGVAGFDNVSVVFGGSDPRAALRRVRESLERSLEFRSERQTEVDGFPALALTALAKRRVYGIFGGGVSPVPPTPPAPTVDYMYFEAAEANSTVSMISMLETAPNLEYSTDGVTWQEWQHTTADDTHTFDTITLGAVGDKVYLRGDNPDGLAYLKEGEDIPRSSNFILTGAINGGGNIMSLLDPYMELTEVPPFGFTGLFAAAGIDSALLTPPSMKTITAIGESGCQMMYQGCNSIITAADMSQLTTIVDYSCFEMYGECTAITTAAVMSALTTIGLGGCSEMYAGCTSLIAAADMPALTTISGGGCSAMYSGCTSLIAAADMPALTTISGGGCSEMYRGCTALTTAADMPAITAISEDGFVCYKMYAGCTALTTAADMSAITAIGGGGCFAMYSGCTSLTSTARMSSLTTISEGGCSEMYSGCTSLTAAADMPVLITIGDNSCNDMYGDCTFDMSDDGTTLNFAFPTPPITTTGENPETYATAYDVANWMGNTNGFTNP